MRRRYLLPPSSTDSAGRPRRAGFEFELGNLPILKAANSLQEALGGELAVKNPFEATLHGTTLGALKIERDARILKSVTYRKWLQQLGLEFEPGSIGHDIETNIDSASSLLIPCEVVTEPVPFDRLYHLERLVTTLSDLGAEGTQDSFIYAFGLHINPSLADREVSSLLRTLQAFLLLHSWIIETAEIDITRRFFTKFIDPFPAQYEDRVLSYDYRPSLEEFTGDYLRDNPTRNRALDLLPILAELRLEQVMSALPVEERHLVRARPAFHYRLPDCKVNVAGWSVAEAWNQWVFVEKLAADEALLRELISEWWLFKDGFSLAPKLGWTARLTSILTQKFFER